MGGRERERAWVKQRERKKRERERMCERWREVDPKKKL